MRDYGVTVIVLNQDNKGKKGKKYMGKQDTENGSISLPIHDPNHIYSDSGSDIVSIKEEEAFKSSEDMRDVAVDQGKDVANVKKVNNAILPCWGGPSAEKWYGAAQTLKEYIYTCELKLANTSVELVRINATFQDTDAASEDRAGSSVKTEG